jgi:hypothetical protein
VGHVRDRLPASRPDAQVKVSGAAAYLGNNVYNTTGTAQTSAVTAAAGTKATFLVNVQNDGSASDSYVLKGAASSRASHVKYFAGTTDITAAVVGGTYSLAAVAPGAAKSIQAQVAVGSGVAAGSAKTSLVTAKSTKPGAPATRSRPS